METSLPALGSGEAVSQQSELQCLGVSNPEQFGVLEFDQLGRVLSMLENQSCLVQMLLAQLTFYFLTESR